jgi:MFS family permease
MTNKSVFIDARKLAYKLVFITISIVTASIVLLFINYMSYLKENFVPEAHKRAMAIAYTTNLQIEKLLSLGVPFDKFQGMTEFLDKIPVNFKDIKYVVISNKDGGILYTSTNNDKLTTDFISKIKITRNTDDDQLENLIFGDYINSSKVITNNGEKVGILHIGTQKNYYDKVFESAFYDSMVIIIAILLISFEIFRFSIFAFIKVPINNLIRYLSGIQKGDFNIRKQPISHDEIGDIVQAFQTKLLTIYEQYQNFKKNLVKDISLLSVTGTWDAAKKLLEKFDKSYRFDRGEISDSKVDEIPYLRLVVFLFFLSEAIIFPFLPFLGQDIYYPLWKIPSLFLIALPIISFALSLSITLPLLIYRESHLGFVKGFTLGIVFCVIGLVFSGILVGDLFFVSLGRFIEGIGYAIALASIQRVIVPRTSDNKKKPLIFLFLIVPSSMSCGVVIGSTLVSYINYQSAFFISALIAVCALFVCVRFPGNQLNQGSQSLEEKGMLKDIFNSKPLLLFILSSVIPSKMIMWTFILYWAHLYFGLIGSGQKDSGHILMIQGIVILLFTPIHLKLIRNRTRALITLWAGSFIAAASLIPIYFYPSYTYSILITVILLGGSSALILPSIGNHMLEYSDKLGISHAHLFQAYQFFESLGTVLSLLIASVFIQLYGYEKVITSIGVPVVLCSLFFALWFALRKEKASSKIMSTKVRDRKKKA